ncbi:gliding motility protein GldB-related protein [Spirosoma fluminis]
MPIRNTLNQKLFYVGLVLFCVLQRPNSYAQIRLHTEDLPRFFEAFDSVMTTSDTSRQSAFIQKLYVDKASKGLKEFMELRGGSTPTWRMFMATNKSQLVQKRPHILSALNQEAEILKKVALFKRYYPNFREGDIYFCVGINNSGGTIRDNTVYIGTEIGASADPNWASYLVLHEFTHTQQYEQRSFNKIISNPQLLNEYEKTHTHLLGKCISEGMADFVAELVLGQRLAQLHPEGYIAFGLQHELRVWEEFKKDMNQTTNTGWLYGERQIDGKPMRDLGYFVGYQICKSYYEKAKDKPEALQYMIELNLTDDTAKNFLVASGYQPRRP